MSDNCSDYGCCDKPSDTTTEPPREAGWYQFRVRKSPSVRACGYWNGKFLYVGVDCVAEDTSIPVDQCYEFVRLVPASELATLQADCERWSREFARQADELVAVKAKLDLVTSNFHTLLNERFLENSELRQRAEAAEMRMKQLLDALRLCKLYGSQGDIDDGRKGAVSVSYYVDKAIDAAEAALATTPPADGAQSS